MSVVCNLQALILAFLKKHRGRICQFLFSRFTTVATVKPLDGKLENSISVLGGLILTVQAVLLRVRSEKT